MADKGERTHNLHRNTLKGLKELVDAAGLEHPNQLRLHHIMRRVSAFEVQPLSDLPQQLEPGDLLNGTYRYPVFQRWWPVARTDSVSLPLYVSAERAKPNATIPWCKVEYHNQSQQTYTKR